MAVDRLDLSAFRDDYGRTGSPAYAPALLLKVILYETREGRHSPASWRRSARSSEPVRWLLRGGEPSRSCWYAFRDRIAPYLEDWNRQVLAQAVAQGRTPAQRGALDGTTIAADASRRRLLDEATLQRREEELRQAKAAAPAAAQRPGWMAPTPEGRRRQEERLGRARERRDQLQRRNAGKRASKRKKRERIVVSPSDPEAALGRDKEGVFRLTYAGASRQKRSSPETISLQLYRCATEHCQACPLRSRCTPRSQQGRTISRSEHEELSEALQTRMATAEAKELYRLRGRTVELVNADWKTHRKLRRFAGRGVKKARCQVGVLVLSQNLLALLTAERNDEKAAVANHSEIAA